MPRKHPHHRAYKDETREFLDGNRYDQEQMRCDVLYDEINEHYVCGFCLDDLSHSRMSATYGGDILPVRFFISRKTLKHLRNETCGMCGLPASRAFDD